MTPPLYIALRFLTHRKRALLLSLSGVVFGVAIFICTQAQTQGFTRYFIESNIGSNGALVVRSRFRPRYEPLMVAAKNSKAVTGRRLYFEGITNPNEIMRVSRQFPDVVSCSPVLRGTLSARAGFENATVDLYGIDPALHAQTTDILHQLIDGNFDDFRNNTSAIIIGSRLADLLQTSVGEPVQLLAPNGEYWRFNVAAIARAGIGSIDSTRVYCHARIAQALLQQPSGASMIIYKLRDRNRAPVLASRFETLFQHNATSWQEREESTLTTFSDLANVGGHHHLSDHPAGWFRYFQCAHHVGTREDKGDRHFAFDGLSPHRYFLDFFVAGSAHRCGRFTGWLSVGRFDDVGHLAHSHSASRLVVYESFCGDMGVAALRVCDVSRAAGCVYRQLCSREARR